MTDTKLKEKIDALSPMEKDAIYRYLWKDYVMQDISAHAESIGIELSNADVEICAERYVYDSEYDCNLDYWTNLEKLIKEQKGDI